MKDDGLLPADAGLNSDDKLLSLRVKLFRGFIAVGVVGISLVAVVMFFSLYSMSREAFVSQSRERAVLIRTGLLSTMMSTGDSATIRRTVDLFKRRADFGFRMVRSAHVRIQFGDREGEAPRDKVENDILSGDLAEYSNMEGSTFRFVTPFVTDERCGRCHMGLDGNPIAKGKVNGLAEFVFDISESQNRSLRLISETVFFMAVMMTFIGVALYFLLANAVLKPVKNITDAIGGLSAGDKEVILHKAESREMAVLARQVGKMAEAVEARRLEHERAIDEERKTNETIRSFAMQQADRLGIADQDDVSEIIKRLSTAVSEVEKAEMLRLVCEFVKMERKEIILRNDIHLIRPAALYLTDLIGGKNGGVKKGAMELALEEAITNSMVHGNLEVESILKEEDPAKFDSMVLERGKTDPYRSREVIITYEFTGTGAVFNITDQGKGFDWRSRLERETAPDLMPHGRGIVIIRAFATSVAYNDAGNSLTVTFDI